MLSRWTDFLTTDGEKETRNRDTEFVQDVKATPDELVAVWNEGWDRLFGTLSSLTPADLEKTVTIRGVEHTVMDAIQRSLAHYASHVGQIVFLAKHLASKEWESLSIPPTTVGCSLPPTNSRWWTEISRISSGFEGLDPRPFLPGWAGGLWNYQ